MDQFCETSVDAYSQDNLYTILVKLQAYFSQKKVQAVLLLILYWYQDKICSVSGLYSLQIY